MILVEVRVEFGITMVLLSIVVSVVFIISILLLSLIHIYSGDGAHLSILVTNGRILLDDRYLYYHTGIFHWDWPGFYCPFRVGHEYKGVVYLSHVLSILYDYSVTGRDGGSF